MAAAVVRSLVAVVVLLVAVVLAVAASASAASLGAAGGDHLPLGILASSGGRRECRGTVGECLAGGDDGGEFDGEEGELGSAAAEAHRRVLAGRGRGYISYGALRRDSVPCSRRGASYYNCRPGASANPYHRGCSRITRCRG